MQAYHDFTDTMRNFRRYILAVCLLDSCIYLELSTQCIEWYMAVPLYTLVRITVRVLSKFHCYVYLLHVYRMCYCKVNGKYSYLLKFPGLIMPRKHLKSLIHIVYIHVLFSVVRTIIELYGLIFTDDGIHTVYRGSV